MAEWLILRLPRTPEAPIQWMPTDAQGQPLAALQNGALPDAAAQAVGRRVCAVVASGDALITDVELPVKAGARLHQLVPYALEEQLAADVDTLHFAIGPRTPDTARTQVAVIARALMDEWLAVLAQARLTPERLCAESTLLPLNPGHTVALLAADVLCVRRTDGSAPLMLPAEDPAGSLAAIFGAETLASEHLILYVAATDWTQCGAQVEALRSHCASLKVQLLNSGALPLLAPQAVRDDAFNLLQGGYALKTSHATELRRWRVAAALAAALLVLHVGAQGSALWQLKHREAALDASIRTVATRAFPGDPGNGDVRERMQQRLMTARSGAAGAALLHGLAALAHARSSTGALSLQALSFRDGALDLRVRAANADSLERIIESLQADGWQADLTSGAAADGGYDGRVTMHPANMHPAGAP